METCAKMANMYSLDYEETELRLGLPGAGEDGGKNTGKRSFSETVDLKLNLQTAPLKDHGSDHCEKMNSLTKEKNLLPPCTNDPEKPPAPKYVIAIFSHFFFVMGFKSCFSFSERQMIFFFF